MGKIFADTESLLMEESSKVYSTFLKAIPKELHLYLYRTGSAGIKPISHDLDVMLEASKLLEFFSVDNLQIAKQLLCDYIHRMGFVCKKHGQIVHVRVPILTKFIQVDIFPIDHAAQLSMLHNHDYAEMGDIYTGKDKHILLWHIAKARNLHWSPFKGLYFNNVISDPNNFFTADPNKIAAVLLDWSDISHFPNAYDLRSPQSIVRSVSERYLNSAMKEFKMNGIPFPPTPYFMRN